MLDSSMFSLLLSNCFVSQYNKYNKNISVLDGVPMHGRRIIIPASLIQSVLDSLHSAHQCSVKMQDRAKHWLRVLAWHHW